MSDTLLSVLRTHEDREIPVAGEYTIDPVAHYESGGGGLQVNIARARA